MRIACTIQFQRRLWAAGHGLDVPSATRPASVFYTRGCMTIGDMEIASTIHHQRSGPTYHSNAVHSLNVPFASYPTSILQVPGATYILTVTYMGIACAVHGLNVPNYTVKDVPPLLANSLWEHREYLDENQWRQQCQGKDNGRIDFQFPFFYLLMAGKLPN